MGNIVIYSIASSIILLAAIGEVLLAENKIAIAIFTYSVALILAGIGALFLLKLY